VHTAAIILDSPLSPSLRAKTFCWRLQFVSPQCWICRGLLGVTTVEIHLEPLRAGCSKAIYALSGTIMGVTVRCTGANLVDAPS